MYIEKYEKMPILTDGEVREQAENIFNFLKLIHQYMEDRKNAFYDPNKTVAEQVNADSLAIELRALRRDREEKAMYRNFRLYRFVDSELERLYKFLKELNNKNIPYCLYYSAYCFDANRLSVSKQGYKSKEWNNKIAENNCIGTQILISDFDNITEDEFILEKMKLMRLGIETLDIFSGHGFQSLILLDKPTEDKDLVRKFTNLLFKKGFKVDGKIKNASRLMRPGDVVNAKELIKTDIENPMIIKTFIYNYTEERYSLDEVFGRLETLETIIEIEDDEIVNDKNISIEKPDNKSSQSNATEENLDDTQEETVLEEISEDKKSELTNLNYDINKLKTLYPMLNVTALPEPILLMLEGFRNGYANNMLLCIVLYLKEKGYSKSIIIQAMQILAEQDRFNYSWNKSVVKSETERFYYSNYEWRKVFASDLKGFGYIDYEIKDKSVVVIENYIFGKISEINLTAFCIYLKLILENNRKGKYMFTIDEIVEISGYKRRTVIKYLDDLTNKARILSKNRAYKKNGDKYNYKLLTIKRDDLGYTKMNSLALKTLLNMTETDEINNTQLALCLYLKYVCYAGKDNCRITQENLAKALGISQSAISKTFTAIEKTGLIVREKEEILDFQFRYKYTIHY